MVSTFNLSGWISIWLIYADGCWRFLVEHDSAATERLLLTRNLNGDAINRSHWSTVWHLASRRRRFRLRKAWVEAILELIKLVGMHLLMANWCKTGRLFPCITRTPLNAVPVDFLSAGTTGFRSNLELRNSGMHLLRLLIPGLNQVHLCRIVSLKKNFTGQMVHTTVLQTDWLKLLHSH